MDNITIDQFVAVSIHALLAECDHWVPVDR